MQDLSHILTDPGQDLIILKYITLQQWGTQAEGVGVIGA